MELIIYKSSLTTDKFTRWLLGVIRMSVLGSLVKQRLAIFDNYISTHDPFHLDKPRKHISTLDIVKSGLVHLECVQTKENYTIRINPNVKLYGCGNTKVLSACKFVNYGNFELKGMHVFSDVFEEIANNIEKYYKLFSVFNPLDKKDNE